MSLSGEDIFYVFFSLLISCPFLQMNINPPKRPFKINRPGPQNYKSQYITEYQSLLYIFMCLKYWICRRESIWYSQIMTLSCLDVKYSTNFPSEYFIFVRLKFVHFKKGINFRCLSICLGYSRMVAVVLFNTDGRIQ